MPIAVVILIVAGVALLGVLSWQAEKRRREVLREFAAKNGFVFQPQKNRALAGRFGFLDKLARGSNRYAFNVMRGRHRSFEVTLFDYHYETHSTDSKGRRRTHHHYLWCGVLALPRAFPELLIAPEGIFSKIAQSLGYADIDFESHEFSRRFCVRSPDKKFAYDVCHARLIEYLLKRPDTVLEIENDALAASRSGRMRPEKIPALLELLADVRELMPDYLFGEP